ncbi:zinc-binding dehydrogenase [Lentzea sp. NPDC059081]|uniref:zinc-binding dehydrogenase n=1 Tax=Lentzea sp. NPDC059081 TaxID=3346719 RepID=UPI0036B4E2A3
MWTLFRSRRVIVGISVNKRALLPVISSLADGGKLRVVIDRTYPLARIAEAHRHVDSGHKRGNVVITVL